MNQITVRLQTIMTMYYAYHMSLGYECVDMFSINRKEKGKKTAKKYHTVGRPQTPMESPYKGAHMYMTAKFPELLQAFTHHRILLGQALCICIFF